MVIDTPQTESHDDFDSSEVNEPASPELVLDVALAALTFEHAHAEASRSRAIGMLTACGVLLALTVGLGSTAADAAQRLTHVGGHVAVIASTLAAVCLLTSAVLSGLVFAPSQETRTPVEELRELAEVRLREADSSVLANHATTRLAAARDANLRSRSRILRAMGFYIAALGFLGAQVLVVAIVHLFGV